jgi:hypothetical protein
MILYFAGLNLNQVFGYFSMVILAVCIFIFGKLRRDKELDGYTTYSDALGYGILVGVFASILVAFFTFIEIKFLDPSIVEKQLDIAQQKMADKGLSEEQIGKALEISKKFMTPAIMFIATIFSFAFWSLIISLITSAIIKKNPNPFDSAMKNTEEPQNQ